MNSRQVAIWLALAFLLVIMAEFYPKPVKIFLVLLIASVVVLHARDITSLINRTSYDIGPTGRTTDPTKITGGQTA